MRPLSPTAVYPSLEQTASAEATRTGLSLPAGSEATRSNQLRYSPKEGRHYKASPLIAQHPNLLIQGRRTMDLTTCCGDSDIEPAKNELFAGVDDLFYQSLRHAGDIAPGHTTRKVLYD